MQNNELFSYYVQDYFSNYLPNIRRCSDNTIKTYKNVFIDIIKFLKLKKLDIKTFKMNDFTLDFINDYIAYLKTKNDSSSTINLKITTVKSFIKYLYEKSVIYSDLYSRSATIKSIKKENKIPRYLTAEEINFILSFNYKNTTLTENQYVIFLVLFYGGLRVSELCNLKRENIEYLDNNTFQLTILNSKNNKSRIIKFQCSYGKHIINYIKNSNLNESNYLFLNKYNSQYTRKGISYIINKIYSIAKENCDNANLFKDNTIHNHMMRHSRAMQMLNNGVTLPEIKQFLGHSYLSTTETYARIDSTIIEDTIISHANNINANKKYSKKDKQDLELWLKTLK